MRRCFACTLQRFMGIALAMSAAQGCAALLSLDDFDEASDAGTSADSGQDVEDANEVGSCSLTINPPSHNFGPVTVGDTSTPIQFKITNEDTAPAGPLALSGGLSPNPNFVIIAQNCADRTLEPGESCTVDFVFQPTTPGVGQSAVLIVRIGPLDCATAFLEGGAPPN